MTSWIDTENSSGFSLHILPYGIFSTDNLGSRIGLAVGDYILDMKVLTQERIFAAIEFNSSTLEAATLNAYAAEGKSVHQQVRNIIQKLLVRDTSLGLELRDYPERRERALVKMSEATMHLPMSIGDYTDFFVGQYHAQNVSANRLLSFIIGGRANQEAVSAPRSLDLAQGFHQTI
jgi:fumarylacetoacetase